MSRTLLILLLPAIIFAGNMELSLHNNNGNSSYIVQSDTQKLKSELIFAFNFTSIDLNYNHDFNYFSLGLNASTIIESQTSTGEDYDWLSNELTVYSKSQNKIDKYYNIGFNVAVNVHENIDLFGTFNYKVLDMSWANTYQKDYVANKTEQITAKTLSFEQKFYQYNLGIKYKNTFLKKISLELKPSLVYAFVNTKDSHLLRNFYTTQNVQAFGYDLSMNIAYTITTNSNIKVGFSYINIEDLNVAMNYYNDLNKKYASLASEYYYENTSLSIAYTYSF